MRSLRSLDLSNCCCMLVLIRKILSGGTSHVSYTWVWRTWYYTTRYISSTFQELRLGQSTWKRNASDFYSTNDTNY